MNPVKLAQMKPKLNEFKSRHPKFFPFFSYIAKNGLTEGSILEIKATDPEGKETCTNIKLTKEDEEFLKEIFSAL